MTLRSSKRHHGIRPAARRAALASAVLLAAVLAAGCHQKMREQPGPDPLQESDFFEDGRASRPLVEGTVARGQLIEDEALLTGMSGGQFVTEHPLPLTRELLERGRERYDIFCSPCHGRVGDGLGMVVRRGYPEPPSLHIDRLRGVRNGYLYDVIARGFGRMPSYAAQVPVRDRWAIVAYVRALQLSQAAGTGDVRPAERHRLDETADAGEQAAGAVETHGGGH
jgi:hypothetical protein